MGKPLLVLVGPTATGKTDLAINLAQKLDGEIISADSMLIYKGMDIGTAKPSTAERESVPHHLIDVVEPDEDFSVAVFQKMAIKIISLIQANNKVPILVGGTGLYVRSITDSFNFTEADGSPSFRLKLMERASKEGNAVLLEELRRVDPVAADRLHPNDLRRIIRALEVYHFTGKPISLYQKETKIQPPPFEQAIFGLTMEREILYKQIEKRVDRMLEKGLVKEVQGLLSQGYGPELVSMQGLGYKEIIKYLQGEYTLDEAIAVLKRNTRHFAKRQITWFRRDPRIVWYDVSRFSNIEELAVEICRKMQEYFPQYRIYT